MTWNPFKLREMIRVQRMLIHQLNREHDADAKRPAFVPDPIPGVDLLEWRKSASLVGTSQKLLAEPHFALMLAVLDRSSPAYDVLALEAPPHLSVALQRRAEGWHECLKALQSLGNPWTEAVQPEETFEPETINTNP